MATTTNYGWTTPDDTALVKDGASAIRSLGTAIDTAMNTALGTKKSGLVLLNTTSMSAVASQSVSTVFNATYENYRIVFDIVSNAQTSNIGLRLRSGSTDNSSAQYDYGFIGFTAAGASYSGNAQAATSFNQISRISSTGSLHTAGYCDIFRPFETFYTTITNQAVYPNATNNPQIQNYGGQIRVTTSYDGFTIITDNALTTLTGVISTYGYNK